MSSPISHTKTKIFLFCIGLLAVSAMALESQYSLGYALGKGLTTTMVIFLALTNRALPLHKLIITGLIFCLAGDLLLLNQDYFVFGLISFFTAHAIFLYVLLRSYPSKNKRWIYLVFWSIGGGIFYLLYPNLKGLTYPVLAYVLIISSMSAQAARAYILNRNNKTALLFAGALFFMLSDTVLAYSKFVFNFSFSSLLILSTYWTAISLIALSNSYLNQAYENQS